MNTPTAAPPNFSPRLLFGISGLLTLLLVIALAWWLKAPPQPGPAGAPGTASGATWALPPLPQESLEARFAETSAAFNTDSKPASPQQVLELVQFFSQLDKALSTPAGSEPADSAAPDAAPSGAAVIDYERLFQEVHRHGIVQNLQFLEDPQYRAGMIAEIAPTGPEWLEALSDVARFNRVWITKVIALPKSGEVLVYLHRTDAWGGFGKERWWLTKTPAGWKIYDYENLYTGERCSQYLAWMVESAMQGGASPVRLLVGLGKSAQFTREDPVAAATALQAIDGAALPPALRALYEYCAGTQALRRQEFAQALVHFTAALALRPAFTAALILQGECWNRLGRPEDALAAADRIDRQVGRDPRAAELRAAALVAQERFETVPGQFRTVLDFQPADRAALLGLYESLPPGTQQEAVARFQLCAKQSGPEFAAALRELFGALAAQMVKARDADNLMALVDLQAAQTPHDDYVALYRVKGFQLRDQPQATLEFLQGALPKVLDPKVQALLAECQWRAYAQLGRAVEGYEKATDRSLTFRALAEMLQDLKDVDGLAALILAHHKNMPEDPHIHFYAGIRSLLMTDFPRAEAHLEQAVASAATDKSTRALFLQYWLFAAYKADHGIQAYDASAEKERKAAFVQLKRYYFDDGRYDLMEMLVNRFQATAPEDPELALAMAELDFIGGRYQAAIDTLLKHRKEIQLAGHGPCWELYDCLLRSHARLKQWATAEGELVNIPDEGEKAFFTAVIMAGRGDTAKTEAALAECIRLGLTLPVLYGDSDLGPVLQSEPFAGVRTKFPPPPPAPTGPVQGPVKPPEVP